MRSNNPCTGLAVCYHNNMTTIMTTTQYIPSSDIRRINQIVLHQGGYGIERKTRNDPWIIYGPALRSPVAGHLLRRRIMTDLEYCGLGHYWPEDIG